MNYFVQEIARNYLKNLPDGTEEFTVHQKHLHGLSEEEFKDGYYALILFMRGLYADIIKDPSSFGMPLIDAATGDHGVDYSKSHSGFVRVPRLLLAIGLAGMLNTDMTLSISGGEFLKITKKLIVTGVNSLLQHLADYGFEITGFAKKVNLYDEITIGYPDCRALPAVLSSFAKAHTAATSGRWYADIEHFYMMTPQLIESETPKIKFGIEYLYRCLNGENREIAKVLHDFVVGKNHKTKTLFSGFMRNIWTCSYTGIKTKKTIMSLKTRQDRLRVKLNLENIREYMDAIMQMPGYIRENIRSNGDPCNRSHQCFSKCIGGFAFEMDGIAYKTCRVSAFWFNNLSIDDIPYIKNLLELEMRRDY